MKLYVVLKDIFSNFSAKKNKSDGFALYAKSGDVCAVISDGYVCICEKYKKSGTTYISTGERFPVLKSKIREI